MSNQRKSFIIFKDSLSILDELSDQQAGLLFKAIRAYQNNEKIEMDALTRIAFSPFRNQFERDCEKYENVLNRNKVNGAKGGRPKSTGLIDKPKEPTGLTGNPSKPRKADSVSVSDSVSESVSDSVSDLKDMSAKANPSFELFQYWCDVMGKSLSTTKFTPKRDRLIKSRLKDGYSVDKIRQAIDNCRADPFSMGQNDRQKPYNDIELICRTCEKLESFIGDSSLALEPTSKLSDLSRHNIGVLQGMKLE
jgi:hypothetical protein